MFFTHPKLIIPTLLLSAMASHSALAVPQAHLVKDILQGEGSSIYPWKMESLNINGTLYFTARDEIHGNELWQSDGTDAGTKLVKDFLPGSQGSGIEELTQIGNFIYLSARTGTSENYLEHTYELIKVDLITGKSVTLKTEKINLSMGDVHLRHRPSPASPFSQLTNVNGVLYFSNVGSGHNTTTSSLVNQLGTSLWKSDGTLTGTVPVDSTLFEFKGSLDSLTKLNNKVFFYGSTTSDKNQIWQSDGTLTGTSPVNAGFGSFLINPKIKLLSLNNSLFFQTYTSSIDIYHLWTSDGTTDSTKVIKDLKYTVRDLVAVNDKAFFNTRFSSTLPDSQSLWVSDGTDLGTTELKQFEHFSISDKTNVNGTLYFTATEHNDDPTYSLELWKSDGTTVGTQRIKSFNITKAPFNKPINVQDNSTQLRAINNTLVFNIVHPKLLLSELWHSDGTETGTKLVHSFDLSSSFDPKPRRPGDLNRRSPPFSLTTANNKVFFTATDDAHGEELWVVDVTPTEVTNPPVCETGIDPQTIKKGDGTALWWWSDNATTASIDNGIGNITIPSNYKWIYPTETTTFTMTAKGANGTATTCQTTLVVETGTPIAKPPVCEMGADPQSISQGEGVALWWWSDNATLASIDHGISSVTIPSDYTWFYPTQTATYTMSIQGADGSTSTCNTTITVN